MYDNVYLAFLGENLLKLLFDTIQLIGSTRPQFDVWPNPNYSLVRLRLSHHKHTRMHISLSRVYVKSVEVFVSVSFIRFTSLCFVFLRSSAGVGRTGVLIFMETVFNMIEAAEPIFPLEIVRRMRDQRCSLIQTPVSKALTT